MNLIEIIEKKKKVCWKKKKTKQKGGGKQREERIQYLNTKLYPKELNFNVRL